MLFKAQRPAAPGMGEPRQASGALGAKADVCARGQSGSHAWWVQRLSRKSRRHSRPTGSKTRPEGASQKGHAFHSADRPSRSDPSPEEQVGLQREAGVTWQKSRAACTFYAPTSELNTRSGHLDHSPWRAALTGWLQATARASRKDTGWPRTRGERQPVPTRGRPWSLHIWCACPSDQLRPQPHPPVSTHQEAVRDGRGVLPFRLSAVGCSSARLPDHTDGKQGGWRVSRMLSPPENNVALRRKW